MPVPDIGGVSAGRGSVAADLRQAVLGPLSTSLLVFRVAQSCFGALGDAVIAIGDVQHCRPRFGVVHLLSAGASLFGAVPPVPGNRLIMLISTAYDLPIDASVSPAARRRIASARW